MLRKLRKRLTYANVMSTIAVFGVLATGTAYAANTVFSSDIVDGEVKSVDVGNNEIGSPDVKDNSLNTFDVHSFLGVDVVDSTLTGADVQNASLTAADMSGGWAAVNSNGTVARSVGVNGVTPLGAGVYRVDFVSNARTDCGIFATQGNPSDTQALQGQVVANPNTSGDANVRTADSAGTETDRPFFVALLC